MRVNLLREFVKYESSGSIALLCAVVAALIWANSPWQHLYVAFFNAPIFIQIHEVKLVTSLSHIINDGLMTIFFLLVSLEVKRELLIGEINSFAKALLPVIGAAGGMLLPALIYLMFNRHNPETLHGWAIPTATDIAFSLAILMLLNSKIPSSLKAFLTALAIIDDVGAIIIIAVFYTSHLSVPFLLLAFLCVLLLIVMNRFGVIRLLPYLIIGLLLWIFTKESGVHTTLAGVILGFIIPLESKQARSFSPLKKLEHILHPWVSYMIVPLFAFANSGLLFSDIKVTTLLNPLTLGIGLGLFLGKQLGVFGSCWLAVKTKFVKLPNKMNWLHLYGVSLLCGIGFTISLFIGDLAFSNAEAQYLSLVKMGVIFGSLISGIVGYSILWRTAKISNRDNLH